MLGSRLKFVVLLGASFVLAGCFGLNRKIDVQVVENHDIDAKAIKSHAIMVAPLKSGNGGVADKSAQRAAIVKVLKGEGFRVVADDAGVANSLLLSFGYLISDPKRVQRMVRVPITITRHVPTRQGKRTVMTLQSKTVGYDNKMVEELHYTARLNVSIHEKGAPDGKKLYDGEASVVGKCAAMPLLYSSLADGLLTGFPGKSGSTRVKKVSAAKC